MIPTTLYIQGRFSLLLLHDGSHGLSASDAFPYLHQYVDCLETHFWHLLNRLTLK